QEEWQDAARDRRRIASRALGVLADRPEALRDPLRPTDGAARREDEPAVAPAPDRLEDLRPAAREPERRRHAVVRRQLDDGAVEPPELPGVGDRIARLEERAHETDRLYHSRISAGVVVAVRPDVLPLAGGEHEDRTALREVLHSQKLLREDRGPAADRVEDAAPDPDAAGVLAEDAHHREHGELCGELRPADGAVAEVRRPERVRVLELELVAGPEVIEPRCLERLRGADDIVRRRVARRV